MPGKQTDWEDQGPIAKLLTVLVCACVGAGALGFGAFNCERTLSLLRHGTRTTGHIVDPRQHPRVGFTDSSGRPVVFVQNGFLVRPLGASVPVIYQADDPGGSARANTIPCMWWGVFWLLPMGLVATFGAIAGARELLLGNAK